MKYLSCPLCGAPEPELIREDVQQSGQPTYLISCFNCCKQSLILVNPNQEEHHERA